MYLLSFLFTHHKINKLTMRHRLVDTLTLILTPLGRFHADKSVGIFVLFYLLNYLEWYAHDEIVSALFHDGGITLRVYALTFDDVFVLFFGNLFELSQHFKRIGVFVTAYSVPKVDPKRDKFKQRFRKRIQFRSKF